MSAFVCLRRIPSFVDFYYDLQSYSNHGFEEFGFSALPRKTAALQSMICIYQKKNHNLRRQHVGKR